MGYYGVPLDCPDCKVRLKVDTVGISSDWKMAVNYHCSMCAQSGGTEFELADLVEDAQSEDGLKPTSH